MSETSFKIKCSKSASARRFSLSKPTLADLRNHVEASWGASGPSFWYVDDDGDRIEVINNEDFEAASSQLKSSCVCLNVDFISDQVEFKSSGNGDWVSSGSACSETSHDDDGFISVELHRPVEDALSSIVVADFPISSRDHPSPVTVSQSSGSEEIATERQDQGPLAADVAYQHKIVNAIEEMVTSSGMGWSRESFRAAVESSDAVSLKLMIQNSLLLSSCVSQVREIAHTAIKRIEHCMVKSSKAERREQKAAAKLERHVMGHPPAEELKQADLLAAPVHDAAALGIGARSYSQRVETQLASRDKVASRFAGCVNSVHPLHDTSSAEYAHQCRRAQTIRETERAQVAAAIERNLATRHSLRDLKKAHIVVAPVEARAAALERAMIAKRLEKDLFRGRLASQHSEAAVDSSVQKPDLSWASIAGSHASSEDIRRYKTCSDTLGSMGFDPSEELWLAIVAHNCNIDAILQHTFHPFN